MSALEDLLFGQIKLCGLPEPIREHLAIPGRRFRFDFYWPEPKLLVEVQGGVWSKGGHTSGIGMNRDSEKMNLAVLLGFRCLSVTSNQIKSGKAVAWIKEAVRMAA